MKIRKIVVLFLIFLIPAFLLTGCKVNNEKLKETNTIENNENQGIQEVQKREENKETQENISEDEELLELLESLEEE